MLYVSERFTCAGEACVSLRPLCKRTTKPTLAACRPTALTIGFSELRRHSV
jgi:hypothetical protein